MSGSTGTGGEACRNAMAWRLRHVARRDAAGPTPVLASRSCTNSSIIEAAPFYWTAAIASAADPRLRLRIFGASGRFPPPAAMLAHALAAAEGTGLAAAASVPTDGRRRLVRDSIDSNGSP